MSHTRTDLLRDIAEFIAQYETHDAHVWAEDANEAADELVKRLEARGWTVQPNYANTREG